ncbi:sel1 repeat family protein [Candidatus Finniella inopinata]|uniref:Sel1 repeat family protein n=1 Tax=Candidatus Finniella inopinata TaxID=1696036 RepID=A0A4Q7DLC3_9PROT|nr:sel1 repeat family protein [Candidatus Finniella inopinata]RZI45516.1 sel1 repeat family protein [Candidatus Finniella inopinata]
MATAGDAMVDTTVVYQKPLSMAALAWLEQLEDERDQADIAGNFDGFKKITDEISATIGGKYGLSERSATPEEELLIIYSITRTRHRFMGQRNMLNDRYLGYDRAQTTIRLQTDARFNSHMAAVLAIDAMVMKAVNDDEFHDAWSDTKKDPGQLIPGIISHAQTHERKEVFAHLRPAFEAFLGTRRNTMRLANDVFNIFAPKMSLVKVYNEVVPSGGIYKGWTVHNVDVFAYPVTLTEEENARFPDAEDAIRKEINHDLSRSNHVSSIFSSSERAISPSDEIRSKFDLGSKEIIVEYIYHDCLPEQGYRVRGIGPRRFYLSLPIMNPQLAKLLKQRGAIIPDSAMEETYRQTKLILKKKAIPDMIINTAKRGIPAALHNYALSLFENRTSGIKRDVPKAIEVYKDAFNLGFEIGKKNLPILLYKYAIMLFNGTDGIAQKNIQAIEIMREAADLGSPDARRDLSLMRIAQAGALD